MESIEMGAPAVTQRSSVGMTRRELRKRARVRATFRIGIVCAEFGIALSILDGIGIR